MLLTIYSCCWEFIGAATGYHEVITAGSKFKLVAAKIECRQ